ncbi:testis-expressed protein 44 [Monodelphis domestica]|uniref:testis-expressed protein 44 n=1 Tax=Monodelphis domestica TaxID=13616 RepID=UPI0024E22206|nr:testis-expressed protein 44 [Monodelphis domestica]
MSSPLSLNPEAVSSAEDGNSETAISSDNDINQPKDSVLSTSSSEGSQGALLFPRKSYPDSKDSLSEGGSSGSQNDPQDTSDIQVQDTTSENQFQSSSSETQLESPSSEDHFHSQASENQVQSPSSGGPLQSKLSESELQSPLSENQFHTTSSENELEDAPSEAEAESPRLAQSYTEEPSHVSLEETVTSSYNIQVSFTEERTEELLAPRPGPTLRNRNSQLAVRYPSVPHSSSCLVSEENVSYMRSITSLVGGGEGPIRSLSDILVWTETAIGTATGFLDSSRTSVSDVLHGTGTALRSMTSLLGGARTILTTGLLTRTSSVLRTMTHLIGTIERRTVEGLRSAFRFMTSHSSTRRNNSRPCPE